MTDNIGHLADQARNPVITPTPLLLSLLSYLFLKFVFSPIISTLHSCQSHHVMPRQWKSFQLETISVFPLTAKQLTPLMCYPSSLLPLPWRCHSFCCLQMSGFMVCAILYLKFSAITTTTPNPPTCFSSLSQFKHYFLKGSVLWLQR